MSLKFNKINCFKFLITLFCTIGFTYHTISLTIEYLSGKTVVNLFIGSLFEEGLPAITLCPGYTAIDKIANLSQPLKSLYEDYVRLDINSENYKFEKYNIYNQAMQIVKDMLKNGDLNIGNMFYNYTKIYSYENPSIKLFVHETNIENDLKRLFNRSASTLIDEMERYQVNAIPIETTTLGFLAWKCYTFFSHLDPLWRDVNIDFKQISITVKFDEMTYPHMYMPIPLMIHAPNDLPLMDMGMVMPLKSAKTQLVQYSLIKIVRLGRQYETNCRFYGQYYKHYTWSDCITSCIKYHHDVTCDNTKLPLMSTLVREEFVSMNQNKTFTTCSAYTKVKHDAMINCSKHCKLNCQYKHYPANIDEIYEFNNSQAQVIVEHNEMPDVLIKYVPENSLISFICNFGGLLGMWLGLSIITIFEEILIPILKLTWIKIYINLGHQINIQNN